MLHSYIQYSYTIQHTTCNTAIYNTNVYNIMLHIAIYNTNVYTTYVTQLSTIQNVYNIMLHSYLQYKCIQHNVTQLSTIQMYTT